MSVAVDLPPDFDALSAVMHRPTEDNVAALFEQRYADRLRFCKAWGFWLTWTDGRWKADRTDLALDYARRLASAVNQVNSTSIAKASFARGVETLARASRAFATEPAQWDADEWLLNTPAGTVDLRSGDLRTHRREDYVTCVTRVSPAAGPAPLFDRFMSEITCGDRALVDYHRRSLGAILSGARSDHWLLFWIGDGRNGKNTLGDFVAWILGDYARTIPTETLMTSARGERHPTELANLRGVRLALSSEVPEGSHWNESRLKSLTGDQVISARYMRGDFFEFPRTHKHLVFGNHRPLLRVTDRAMRERMHVVPFRATFSDEQGTRDPNLAEKLREEAPAVLAWLIDGHVEWLEDGGLRKCHAVERETADYFEAQSTPDMWLSERCEALPLPDDRPVSTWERAGELYRDFADWKRARGEEPMSQTRWGEWMAARYERRKVSGTPRYSGVRLRGMNRGGSW